MGRHFDFGCRRVFAFCGSEDDGARPGAQARQPGWRSDSQDNRNAALLHHWPIKYQHDQAYVNAGWQVPWRGADVDGSWNLA